MLDWLKPILGDAYNEDLEKNISQKIGKAFVSRKDFNDKNEIVKQLEKISTTFVVLVFVIV